MSCTLYQAAGRSGFESMGRIGLNVAMGIHFEGVDSTLILRGGKKPAAGGVEAEITRRAAGVGKGGKGTGPFCVRDVEEVDRMIAAAGEGKPGLVRVQVNGGTAVSETRKFTEVDFRRSESD